VLRERRGGRGHGFRRSGRDGLGEMLSNRLATEATAVETLGVLLMRTRFGR
jgi:hypothetical protein